MSQARRASDVFVECLEAEGVKYVFGIPGEETLDLNESLDRSSVEFVPVRHEQGGAYMADMYGRLTGRAGVCLGTLGPGALNLVHPVADAFLDRAPLVALTGQSDLERMEPWARIWQTWAGAAFLKGYFSTAGGALFIPADPSQRDALLRLFVVDKALYELNYELNNRPDWVRIPVRGLLSTIDAR